METVRNYPLPYRVDTSHPICPLCSSELEVDYKVEDISTYYECFYCDYYYVRTDEDKMNGC